MRTNTRNQEYIESQRERGVELRSRVVRLKKTKESFQPIWSKPFMLGAITKN